MNMVNIKYSSKIKKIYINRMNVILVTPIVFENIRKIFVYKVKVEINREKNTQTIRAFLKNNNNKICIQILDTAYKLIS